MVDRNDPATSVCFKVTIDKPTGAQDLGLFSSCEGLGAELVIEQREEGGQNGYVHQLPTRLKYTNIKLSRPLTGETEKVVAWFTSMTTKLQPCTAAIEALRGDGSTVARWSLENVVPVRWTGPSMNVDSPKAAMETIEIAHQGFTVSSKGS